MLRLAQAEEVARLEQGCPFWRPRRVWRRLLVCLALSGVSCSRFMPLANAGGSLAVVGPGISEALVATAVGLAAAIPAVVAYNHYLNRIRRIEEELEHFAEELTLLFDSRLSHDVQRVGHRPSPQR